MAKADYLIKLLLFVILKKIAGSQKSEVSGGVRGGGRREKSRLGVELAALRTAVRSEKPGEVVAEFESIHNIQRAQRVGSVHRIVPAA